MSDGLIASDGGRPVAFECLAATFYLDLAPEDGPALEHACASLSEWFGDELRWTSVSTRTGVQPFSVDDLGYIYSFPEQLRFEPDSDALPEDEEQAFLDKRLAGLALTDLSLLCFGAKAVTEASPWSLRFETELLGVPDGDVFQAATVLKLTVPIDHSVSDFRERVLSLAEVLPLSWGNAGFGFSGNADGQPEKYRRATFAGARLFPGFDVGLDTTWLKNFHNRVRSVSWLTWLGPALLQSLSEPPPSLMHEVLAGGKLLLKASEQPQRGDTNRLLLPTGYAEVDRFVKPVRATPSDVESFLPPWDARTTARWLARFEVI